MNCHYKITDLRKLVKNNTYHLFRINETIKVQSQHIATHICMTSILFIGKENVDDGRPFQIQMTLDVLIFDKTNQNLLARSYKDIYTKITIDSDRVYAINHGQSLFYRRNNLNVEIANDDPGKAVVVGILQRENEKLFKAINTVLKLHSFRNENTKQVLKFLGLSAYHLIESAIEIAPFITNTLQKYYDNKAEEKIQERPSDKEEGSRTKINKLLGSIEIPTGRGLTYESIDLDNSFRISFK